MHALTSQHYLHLLNYIPLANILKCCFQQYGAPGHNPQLLVITCQFSFKKRELAQVMRYPDQTFFWEYIKNQAYCQHIEIEEELVRFVKAAFDTICFGFNCKKNLLFGGY